MAQDCVPGSYCSSRILQYHTQTRTLDSWWRYRAKRAELRIYEDSRVALSGVDTWRAQLSTLRAQLFSQRILYWITNQQAGAPFVAVTKGKACSAANVPWPPSLGTAAINIMTVALQTTAEG